LTVIVSITFVITGGGAKAAKHNVKITKIRSHKVLVKFHLQNAVALVANA